MPARSPRKTAEHLENPGAPTFYNFCIKALTVNYEFLDVLERRYYGEANMSGGEFGPHTHSGPWVSLLTVQVLDPKLREARGR